MLWGGCFKATFVAVAFAIATTLVPTAAVAGATGSYSKSCESCSDSGSKLSCSCKKKNGSKQQTSIWYGPCKADSVGNDNGNLKCTLRGSAWRTCRNVSWGDARITAECKMKNGSWNWTSINHTTCSGNFTNCDGGLVCADSCP